MEEESTVAFIRLNTGEDLISEMIYVEKDSIEDAHIILLNPLKVLYMMHPANPVKMAVSLTPWIATTIVSDSDQEFKIYESDILVTGIPSDGMLTYYNGYFAFAEQTTSRKKEYNTSDEEALVEEDLSDQEGIIMLEKLLSSRSTPKEES